MSDGWSYSLKYEGRTVEVPSGRSVIGRSRTSDISISGPSISRRHVDLIANAGKLIVQDLGSSNGTFINGERIRGQGELNDGDKLRLGDIRVGIEIRRTIPAWTPKTETRENQRPTRGRDIASLAPPMGVLPKMHTPQPSDVTMSLRDIDPDELDTAVGVELEPEEKLAIGAKNESGRSVKAEQKTDPSPSRDEDTSESPAAEPDPSEQLTASELPTIKADLKDVKFKVSPTREHLLAASFERRLCAGLLDALWTVGIVVSVAMTGKPIFAGAAIAAIGLTLAAGWAIWGTTPGKQLLGLYVCTEDGEIGVGWGSALLRLLGYMITLLTLGIGFFMALRPSRCALHDTLSKTQVRHRISV